MVRAQLQRFRLPQSGDFSFWSTLLSVMDPVALGGRISAACRRDSRAMAQRFKMGRGIDRQSQGLDRGRLELNDTDID
jgi:hypothetical protein